MRASLRPSRNIVEPKPLTLRKRAADAPFTTIPLPSHVFVSHFFISFQSSCHCLQSPISFSVVLIFVFHPPNLAAMPHSNVGCWRGTNKVKAAIKADVPPGAAMVRRLY